MAIHIDPISPIAFSIFGLEIRWYALAYIAAFILGFWLMRQLAEKYKALGDVKDKKKFWDDIMAYGIIGVIAGGRLGYVLFYNLEYFLSHPLEIFALWHGGMSFHGGLLGVIAAAAFFARVKKVSFLRLMDLAAVAAPIGLFLGRIANFINMEVMGRATESSIGVIFDGTGQVFARHASPLYEAALEGAVLFAIMFAMYRVKWFRARAGFICGSFVVLYAVFRIFAEQFREPDSHIGFLTSWGLTMGQLLSAIMVLAGAAAIYKSFAKTKKEKK
ncbi:MAG: prolipoprotein diacylglyceryl transferase [Rickettsiales bacterium]|jgi:phosphatidylglycerol:prolipoprotein diacylglycerol transferase|nr:prolipoprotein diacylglyceryl transferase [Rickettsiales bacterium]